MAKVTKTLGPIHFEDLDPHRFEDLVRELIYDFKDWQDIEATGRGGSDDGFDIRAWEKVDNAEVSDDEENGDDPQEQVIHPMDGNLWMVQCKREKELGPKKVAEIVQTGVDDRNPPYGYILVAPVDFSKKSHDAFREELRKKGVMEFHLWGRGALEDLLHMPKNDRILFAYFGISLVMRKRSRKTDIRFAMNNKNKLLKVLGSGEHSQDMYRSVLIRNVDDTYYPFKQKYKDFDKRPRWREQEAISLHPKGLIIQIRKFFAYIDREKKEYDYVDFDLTNRRSEREDNQDNFKQERRIRDYWNHLSRKNQIHFEVNAIVLYEDMIVIDDKGDVIHNFPHIYVEYKYKKSPFKAFWEYLVSDYDSIDIQNAGYKRVDFFPKTIPEPPQGKTHLDKFIEPDDDETIVYRHGNVKQLYSVDGKYDFLKQRDKIRVKGTEEAASYGVSARGMVGVEVMSKYEMNVKEYFETASYLRDTVEKKVGRKLKDTENLTILEVNKVDYWEFPQTEGEEK